MTNAKLANVKPFQQIKKLTIQTIKNYKVKKFVKHTCQYLLKFNNLKHFKNLKMLNKLKYILKCHKIKLKNSLQKHFIGIL